MFLGFALVLSLAGDAVVRVEGVDRKSWFAIADSENGVDGFRFWPRPLRMPETDEPDTNVYDMRLTQHDDGFVYGLFCTERKDHSQPGGGGEGQRGPQQGRGQVLPDQRCDRHAGRHLGNG